MSSGAKMHRRQVSIGGSFEGEGYHSIQACQKTYNGVSIISNLKPKLT